MILNITITELIDGAIGLAVVVAIYYLGYWWFNRKSKRDYKRWDDTEK